MHPDNFIAGLSNFAYLFNQKYILVYFSDEIFQETKLGGHQNGRSGSQQVHSSLPQMLMIVLVLTFSLLTNNNR